MKYRLIIIFTYLLFRIHISYSQYYDTGQDPASVKWLQIKTDRFTVIYPESYGNEGILFARSLDDAYSDLTSIFPEKKFRIPVIIHSYSTESNGYVAWAPRRMEIYPTPEQNTIPLDTKKQLAVHELTHAFQMVSLNQGFSKAMSLILGEQFTGITTLLLPLWYFEGNAVFAETFLTESGRGRIPSFQKELKAIALDNDKMYKYDMIVNDSYKKYVPDHYQSGYQMVTYAIARKDPEIWNKTLDYTARNPFLLNPVNLSLSKNGGLSKKKLFKETFDTLKTIWSKELSDKEIIQYKAINPSRDGEYINYSSPVFAGNDSIIAIKTSLKEPPSFVLISPSGKSEKRIYKPGSMYPYFLSCAMGKVVWVENQPDPRWENRNYSIIKILDLKTNTSVKLSGKSRYLAASLSPDGEKIAAIENSIENINTLVIIDAESGKVLHSVLSPQNAALQHPQWESAGNKIIVISLTVSGEGIMSYSIKERIWQTLIEPGRDDLQSAFLRNDSLFYISSVTGTDNICLKTPAGKTHIISKSRFGTNDLYLKDGRILFSNYTSAGNDICSMGINEITEFADTPGRTSSFLINSIGKVPQLTGMENNSKYKPEQYRKYQHLFRFHSWMPFYADIEQVKDDPASVRPGITFMSQNSLSTLTSTIGYEYSEEKENILHSKITWKGWYPVFESQIDYGGNPGIFKSGESEGDPSEIKTGIRSYNSVYVPLSYTSGRFSQYIQPSLNYDYRNNYIYLKEDGKYDYGQSLISARLYFSNYHRKARQDIYPRWAQTIDLYYSFAPFNRDIYGPVASVKTSFYFPGILPGNGIKLRLEKEKQSESLYTLNNRISLPRGYKNIISKEMGLVSLDYAIPMAYPDFNIGSLMYIKRIRCSLFGDYAEGTGNYYLKESETGFLFDSFHDYREVFWSFGVELLADFHVLRLPFLISGGVRSSRTNISQEPVFELLFNIQLFGMAINRENL